MAHTSVDTRSKTKSAGASPPKRCAGYTVYDPLSKKSGAAEEVFANRDGSPQYVRVRIGFFGVGPYLSRCSSSRQIRNEGPLC